MKNSFSLALAIASGITVSCSLAAFAQQAEYRLTPEQQAQAQLQQQQFLQSQYAQAQYMQQQQAYQQAMYQSQGQQALAQAPIQSQVVPAQQLAGQQAQVQTAASEPLDGSVSANKKIRQPSDYELQEQAIQKGLSDNKPLPINKEDYAQSPKSSWSSPSSETQYGRVAKVKNAAKVAGKVITRGAASAVPMVGMVFLSRALMRGTMMGSGMGGMGTGMGGMGGGMGSMMNMNRTGW